MRCTRNCHVAAGLVAASIIVFSPECLKASTLYVQINLVSDLPGSLVSAPGAGDAHIRKASHGNEG